MINMQQEEALDIIWKLIDEHVETVWDCRIGRGEREADDDKHAEDYERVCEAMDHLKSELIGLMEMKKRFDSAWI